MGTCVADSGGTVTERFLLVIYGEPTAHGLNSELRGETYGTNEEGGPSYVMLSDGSNPPSVLILKGTPEQVDGIESYAEEVLSEDSGDEDSDDDYDNGNGYGGGSGGGSY